MFLFYFTIRCLDYNTIGLLALLGVLNGNEPDLMVRCKTPLSFGKLKKFQFLVQKSLIKS